MSINILIADEHTIIRRGDDLDDKFIKNQQYKY